MVNKWAYGVTTVPERFNDLLPKTLESLNQAGFDKPRLFIDGCWEHQVPDEYNHLDVTCRMPRIRTHGNWVLSAYELFIRNADCDRFALFQDDFVTYKNLRQYLDQCDYPSRGYWNLYTFPQNEKQFEGWYLSNQLGKGAVALVFSNEAIRTLMSRPHLINRPLDPNRGWRSVDGGIVTAMKNAGWQEYVHNPSLVQHTGTLSSMGNKAHEKASTFVTPEFDAMELVKKPTTVQPKSSGRKLRIGLVGYNCYTGLGELNHQLATYCDIDTWLVKPHGKRKTKDPHPDVDTIVCPSGRRNKFDMFLNKIDVVLFCETPYYHNLIDYVRTKKKRMVCVPMMEWMPSGGKGWPQHVNLFICPTKQCYDLFSHVVPCTHFPWPTDPTRFKFKQRDKVNKFVFINGQGGYKGRKGGAVIREAKQLWPDMPLTVISQTIEDWPEGTEVLPPAADNEALYDVGDILLYPSSVDGLGLQPMEAMACGMPVITTNGLPWNEHPALERINADKTRDKVRRPVDWYKPSAEHLVEVCKKWVGKNITEESIQVRRWAERNKWERLANEFMQLVREGVPGTTKVEGAA